MEWERLAVELGAVPASGEVFDGGKKARVAIARLLGDEVLRKAVESWVGWDSGAMLADSVLSLLQPKVARDYCRQIVREDPDSGRRVNAAVLFKDMATDDDLPVVEEFLRHRDPAVQVWAVALLRALTYDDETPVDGPYGVMMREHSNPQVRAAFRDNFER